MIFKQQFYYAGEYARLSDEDDQDGELHQSWDVASQQGETAAPLEAGGKQGDFALPSVVSATPISLDVEEFPQAHIANETVRVNVAAAGAVIGARRGVFRFRLDRRAFRCFEGVLI